MKKIKYTISTLVCECCGVEMYVPRKMTLTREKGHLKDIWCPVCRETKHFREYRAGRDYYKNLAGDVIGGQL